MNLDSRQCEALLAVIDSGSFEQAAALLRLTSSAVSQRVRALEIHLGSPLIVRSRPCRPTHAGQRLLQHLRRVQLLEQDLQADFSGEQAELLSIAVAVNADSLSSWLLPAVAEFLREEKVLLDVSLDDQDHTHALLEAGLALGCVSTEPHAMRGCSAESLGIMRYRCVGSPAFRQQWFAKGMQRSSAQKAPVVVFNRKDKLQSAYLKQHFGIVEHSYPCHYIPASDPFMHAIALDMGWGMVPELMLHRMPAHLSTHLPPDALVDLAPDRPMDIRLYWHTWKVQSPRMQKLSQTLIAAARATLVQEQLRADADVGKNRKKKTNRNRINMNNPHHPDGNEQDLAGITAATLDNYNQVAADFREGTRDHDVSQNIAALLRHISAAPPLVLLDFGCGPGRDLKALTDMGHTAIGLDGSEQFVAMARADTGCEVWQQDFLKLDLPAARFDGIFANASLQHVPGSELPRVLKQLRAAIKPGGVLFCSLPRGENVEGWSRQRYSAFHDKAAWWAFMAGAGFTELEHYYRPAGLPIEQQPWLASVWRA